MDTPLQSRLRLHQRRPRIQDGDQACLAYSTVVMLLGRSIHLLHRLVAPAIGVTLRTAPTSPRLLRLLGRAAEHIRVLGLTGLLSPAQVSA